MNKHRHDVKTFLFGNYSWNTGYYGVMSMCGAGGFNFADDFLYMNQSTWTRSGGVGYLNHWCDTGYQNLAAAVPDTAIGWVYEYGLMETANAHTFTLESFMATASWSANEAWDVISYTESHGQLTEKGSKEITSSFSRAETFKFKGADWTGLAAVAFSIVSEGKPGNTCTYGSAVYGVQLCIDKIRYYESKKAVLKNDNGKLLSPYMLQHQHKSAPHVAALHSDTSHPEIDGGRHSGEHRADTAYHTQLLSLGQDTGLTSQFALPHPEHFGP